MKFIIISDVHDNFDIVDNIIFANKGDTDYFIFLGDSLSDYKKSLEKHKDSKFLYAYGNCDYKPHNEKLIKFFLPNKYHKIMYCHGHTLNVKRDLSNLISVGIENNATIILYGHTHISYTNYKNGLYIMNPGSVTFPRGVLPPSYGVLTINEDQVSMEIIENIKKLNSK